MLSRYTAAKFHYAKQDNLCILVSKVFQSAWPWFCVFSMNVKALAEASFRGNWPIRRVHKPISGS